jgi:ribosomal protein L37AE/L43A
MRVRPRKPLPFIRAACKRGSSGWRSIMELIEKFFECSECKNRNFKQIYNFLIRFHPVNFSDRLIYDRLTNEVYECTQCGKAYTRGQIEDKLTQFRKSRNSIG